VLVAGAWSWPTSASRLRRWRAGGDKAYRYLAKRQPRGLLAWLLPGHEQLLAPNDWADTRRLLILREPARTCDPVARSRTLAAPGPFRVLVLGFQSRPERWMLLRPLRYQGDLLCEFGRPAAPGFAAWCS
jgi:hypothetical protein